MAQTKNAPRWQSTISLLAELLHRLPGACPLLYASRGLHRLVLSVRAEDDCSTHAGTPRIQRWVRHSVLLKANERIPTLRRKYCWELERLESSSHALIGRVEHDA